MTQGMEVVMSDQAPVIVDSSIGIALVRNEPRAPVIRAATRRWSESGRTLVVPSLFWLEVVNVLARRHRYGGLDILRAVHELDELDLVTVDPDRGQLLLTIDHIERFGLSSYDASYLALTDFHGGDLATLDHALAAAAGPRAISFDEHHRLSEAPAAYEHDVTWPNYKGASAYLAKLRAEAARPG
jgi:predicted nucleic acid-binding protein